MDQTFDAGNCVQNMKINISYLLFVNTFHAGSVFFRQKRLDG